MTSLSSDLASLRSENEDLRAHILDLESDLELRDERIATLESEMRCFMDIASFDSNGQQAQVPTHATQEDDIGDLTELEEVCISSPILSAPMDGDEKNKQLTGDDMNDNTSATSAIQIDILPGDDVQEEEGDLILSPESQQRSARDSIMDTRRVTLSHFKDFSSPEKLVALFTELNQNADDALYAQSSPSETQSKHVNARRRASTNVHTLPPSNDVTSTPLATVSSVEDKGTRRSSLGVNTACHSSQIKNFNKRLSLTPLQNDSDDSGFLADSVFYDVASPKNEYPPEEDDDLDLDGTIHGHGWQSNQSSPRHATDTSLSLDEHSPSNVNNSPTNFVDTHSQILKTPSNKKGALHGVASSPSTEERESSESDKLISSTAKKRVQEAPKDITYSAFLHRILMPSSSDLASTVQRFLLSIAGNIDNSTSVQSFLNNNDGHNGNASHAMHNNSNEMSNTCNRFFDGMEAQIRTHASWRAESEENVKCIRDHLETYVFLQIYPYTYASVEREYAEEESSVYKKMLILSQFLAPRNLDIDYPELQHNDSLYKIAGEELRKMNRHTIPSEKMACIIRSASLVSRVLSVVRLKHGYSVHSGADDFLPLFIYVVLKSKARDLVLNCEYISAFYNPTRLMGMAGYTLMNLRSALQFINEMSSGDISHMSVSEFETNYAIFKKRIEAKLANK